MGVFDGFDGFFRGRGVILFFIIIFLLLFDGFGFGFDPK